MPNFLDFSNSKVEDIFNGIYGGDFSATNLPPDLYEAILDKLTEGVAKGFGNFDPKEPKAKVFTGLVDNLAVFSAAKTYQQVNDMQNFLFDSLGNKRPFSDFKKAAGEIFDTYNDNWLKTEYKTAVGQSQSASLWADYERDKEALPMLKYQTVKDGRVRNDHRDLDGIIKPVDSPFWDKNAPLNGFGCRCRLIQLEEGEETDIKELEKKLGRPIEEPSDLFKFNAGKKGLIFDETVHPYFKVDKRYRIGKKKGQTIKQPPRKPKPVKKELPPKVTSGGSTPDIFKTKKSAKEFLSSAIEFSSKLKIESVTLSSKLSIEDVTRRVSVVNDLFREYGLADATGASVTTKVKFKSSKRTYGFIRSGRNRRTGDRIVTDINFGDQTDSGGSRRYVKGDEKIRFKSKVDEENIDIATTVHEFAHVISTFEVKAAGNATKKDIDFWNDLSEVRTQYYQEITKLDSLKDKYDLSLGKYAGTNANEFMAEGFTEYKLSSEPSKYAVKVGELIDKYYKK